MKSSRRVTPLIDPDKMLAEFDRENSGDKFFTFARGEGWILFTAIAVILGMIAIGVACMYTATHL